MAEKAVTLPSDAGNTGKALRTVENTVGGNLVDQEVITLADSAGNLLLGSKVSAGSLPVVIASDQGTFPVTVTFPGNQVVSGTVTANQGGAPWSITFSAPQHVIVDTAPTTAVTIASLPNEPNLDVALSTRLKPADTLAGVTTVGAVTSITNPVAVSNFPATQVVDDSSTMQTLIDIERGNQSRLDTLVMMFAAVFSPNADLGGLMANINRAQVMTN